MTKRIAFERVGWGALTILGLVVPVTIGFVRARIVCPTLGVGMFDILPVSGVVRGFDPHLFARLMHNLAHPIVLLFYGGGLTCLAIRSILEPVSPMYGRLLLFGAASFHLSW